MFFSKICKLLDIAEPEVSYDLSDFPSNAKVLAKRSKDGGIICIRKQKKQTMDVMLAIAHELRHIWQMRTDADRYLSSYTPQNLCPSVEAYHLQPAEIDANAFSALALILFFQVRPILDVFSPKVIMKIYGRMDEIANELNINPYNLPKNFQ